MPTAAIALGSNLGDRLANLGGALSRMNDLGRLRAVSPIYETDPVGEVSQGPFYNAVAIIETQLDPATLVGRLLAIEGELGRVRGRRWGPRIIDLDLILHGDSRIGTPDISVPHPRYRERRFVLAPLVDAWPDARDPDGTLVADLLEEVADQQVRKLDESLRKQVAPS